MAKEEDADKSNGRKDGKNGRWKERREFHAVLTEVLEDKDGKDGRGREREKRRELKDSFNRNDGEE